MSKAIVFFLRRHRKKQELSNAIGKILFDLLQRRRYPVANITPQSWNWLVAFQSLNDEQWLNQLGAIEFGLRAQIAQVLRSSQAHQTLHHRDISSSHCA